VIEVKYGSVRGGWCSLPVTGPYGVSVWKFIRKGWDSVAKFLRFEVVDGSHIARSPDAWVVDNLSVVGGVVHWNVLFTRYAQDWEVEMVMSFFDQLYSTRVWHGEVDRVGGILLRGGLLK
jgi:hypothetical protein